MPIKPIPNSAEITEEEQIKTLKMLLFSSPDVKTAEACLDHHLQQIPENRHYHVLNSVREYIGYMQTSQKNAPLEQNPQLKIAIVAAIDRRLDAVNLNIQVSGQLNISSPMRAPQTPGSANRAPVSTPVSNSPPTQPFRNRAERARLHEEAKKQAQNARPIHNPPTRSILPNQLPHQLLGNEPAQIEALAQVINRDRYAPPALKNTLQNELNRYKDSITQDRDKAENYANAINRLREHIDLNNPLGQQLYKGIHQINATVETNNGKWKTEPGFSDQEYVNIEKRIKQQLDHPNSPPKEDEEEQGPSI